MQQMVTLQDGIKEFYRAILEEEKAEAEAPPEGPQGPPPTSRESAVAAEAVRVAAGDWGGVFVYGMLCAPSAWGALIGRVPKMRPAILDGFEAKKVAGCAFAGLLEVEGGMVIGQVVSGLKPTERRLMDSVVDDGFVLALDITVRYIDGVIGEKVNCSMYAWREEFCDGLTDQDWDYGQFCISDLKEFVQLCEDRRTCWLADRMPDDQLKELALARRRRDTGDDDEDSEYRSSDGEAEGQGKQ